MVTDVVMLYTAWQTSMNCPHFMARAHISTRASYYVHKQLAVAFQGGSDDGLSEELLSTAFDEHIERGPLGQRSILP